MASSASAADGGHYACGALQRTRRWLTANGRDMSEASPLPLLDGSLGWVYHEYRVAVLVDVRWSAFQLPWVVASVERVLSALANGPAGIFGASAGGGGEACRPALIHVSLVACARGTEPMRVLLHGWTHRCGEPADALLARARDELADLARATATARASSRGGLPVGGNGSRERCTYDGQPYAGGSQPALVSVCAGAGAGASGGSEGRPAVVNRRALGLAGCVQQGLFVLSTLPGCSCPGIALVTDGVSSLSYAPPLALRWRDTAMLIVLPPPGHAAGPAASRFAAASSRLLYDATDPLAVPPATGRGGMPSLPRCVEAFGMVDDFEGLQEVARFANGLMLQLPRSAAADMARRISVAQAGGGRAGGVGSGAGSGAAGGSDGTRAPGVAAVGWADQWRLLPWDSRSGLPAHSPDVAIARALLWRGASERMCVAAHASALLACTPAEWRLRAGAFAPMSPRQDGAAGAAGSRPDGTTRHRERLHQYDVGSEVRVSDLLALRVLEGFTIAFPPPADAAGVNGSPVGWAGWGGSHPVASATRRVDAAHDAGAGGGGVGGGETELRVSLDWVQDVTIEYMVRRRVRQRTSKPSPVCGEGDVAAAAGWACPSVQRSASGCCGGRGRNAGSVGGSEDGPAAGSGSGSCLAPAARTWEARLRVSITVVAPLAFWIQYERLRLSRRHEGQPELSGAPKRKNPQQEEPPKGRTPKRKNSQKEKAPKGRTPKRKNAQKEEPLKENSPPHPPMPATARVLFCNAKTPTSIW